MFRAYVRAANKRKQAVYHIFVLHVQAVVRISVSLVYYCLIRFLKDSYDFFYKGCK